MKEINGCAELASSIQMIHLCIPSAVLQIMQHYLFACMEGNLTLQVALHGPFRPWSKTCLLTLKALSYSSPPVSHSADTLECCCLGIWALQSLEGALKRLIQHSLKLIKGGGAVNFRGLAGKVISK